MKVWVLSQEITTREGLVSITESDMHEPVGSFSGIMPREGLSSTTELDMHEPVALSQEIMTRDDMVNVSISRLYLRQSWSKKIWYVLQR